MSGRLVGEVVAWLRTPVAADLTAAERVVLLVIAERANETTREMWRHKADDVSLSEHIREAVGASKQNISKVYGRLAERGLEVRVQVGATDAGKPVFAFKGHATNFRLPVLPASVELPQRNASRRTKEPVDNPPGEGPGTPDGPPERNASGRGFEAKGTPGGVPKGPKGTPQGVPYPSKELPSTTTPSSCGSSPYGVAVEDTPPTTATPSGEPKIHMGWEPTYKDASALLQTLPDLGGRYMAQAETELAAGTRLADRVIYAAQLAKEAQAS